MSPENRLTLFTGSLFFIELLTLKLAHLHADQV